MIDLTKNEAFSVAEFIDMNLIDTLHNNVDIDSMSWLKNMIHAYEKLCAYSGYLGFTEDDEKS